MSEWQREAQRRCSAQLARSYVITAHRYTMRVIDRCLMWQRSLGSPYGPDHSDKSITRILFSIDNHKAKISTEKGETIAGCNQHPLFVINLPEFPKTLQLEFLGIHVN